VVLIFAGTVILSLFLAFGVTSLLHRAQVERIAQEGMIANGQSIIRTYQAQPGLDLISYLRGIAGISGNALQVYDVAGRPLLTEAETIITADPTLVEGVLAGGIVRNTLNHDGLPLVGIPFESEGEPHALFVMLKRNILWEEITHALRTVLIFILIFGSLLILLSARYLVKPLLRLTEAARRLAQGRFDVEIRTRREDEIGQLTVSFNHMASELAKLDRMRRDFVASVSHEIQTPLTSIAGFSKALKQKSVSEETRLHYLDIIEEESERLSRLGRNLLRLSALQNENTAPEIREYQLDEQIRRAVISLEPQWAAKEIEFDLQLSPVTIQADEDQLKQVWTNLIDNAVKFSPVDGTIRIALIQDAAVTAVTVSDSGMGVPEEEREDIFKPFHSSDSSRDRAKAGNGLGLSIVKRIVELHDGNIAASGGPGGGATFTVRLPAGRAKNP
jgi:signal transduction histidine kinase